MHVKVKKIWEAGISLQWGSIDEMSYLCACGCGREVGQAASKWHHHCLRDVSIQHGICTQHRLNGNLVMHELIAPTQLWLTKKWDRKGATPQEYIQKFRGRNLHTHDKRETWEILTSWSWCWLQRMWSKARGSNDYLPPKQPIYQSGNTLTHVCTLAFQHVEWIE